MAIQSKPERRDVHLEQFVDRFVHQQKNNRTIPKSIYDTYAKEYRDDPLKDGLEAYKKAYEILHKFSISSLQSDIADLVFKCCNKIFFSPQVVARYDRVIKRKLKWKNLKQEQIVSAPRRFGKSRIIAIVSAILALVCPGRIIACFSTGSRASGKKSGLLGQILDMLLAIGVSPDDIDMGKENINIRHADGRVSKIFGYPASRDT